MDFSCVEKRMHALLDLGVPGCSISIRRDHEELYRYICGTRGRDTAEPMTGEEYFYIFSCTKPITVTAAMQLIERGLLKLDAPVSDYIPDFANAMVNENGTLVPPKTPITVRHLFTMSAGMDYGLRDMLKKEGYTEGVNALTTRDVAEMLARRPLLFHPGERFQYSLCHDALGAVIEAAAGMRFGEYLKKNIFEPLGMTKTGFDRNVSPLAAQYECLEETGELVDIGTQHPYNDSPYYESGGGGLVSTLDDYALFADALACDGVGASGERILTRASIDAIRENQLGTFVKDPTFSCATGPGYGYGLGVRTLIDKSQGQRSPLGEFGWDGANGAFLIVDPEHHLSFSFMQHIRNWPRLMGEFYAPIRDEVYDVLGL